MVVAFIVFIPTHDAISGQATLSWDPPTTNVDGTPLTDLAGYKVYYGTPGFWVKGQKRGTQDEKEPVFMRFFEGIAIHFLHLM
jgi:hypothetical protein